MGFHPSSNPPQPSPNTPSPPFVFEKCEIELITVELWMFNLVQFAFVLEPHEVAKAEHS